MGLGNSTPLTQILTLRQDNEPGNPVEGMTWVDTSGQNTERKMWNGSTWELDVAVGPETPSHAVEGARWSKTDEATVLVYDGSSWNSIGVTDHTNLNNVQSGQHHTRPTSTSGLGESFLSWDFTRYHSSLGTYTTQYESVGAYVGTVTLETDNDSSLHIDKHGGESSTSRASGTHQLSPNDWVRRVGVESYSNSVSITTWTVELKRGLPHSHSI